MEFSEKGTMDPMNGRFSPINGRFSPINGHFSPINGRFSPINGLDGIQFSLCGTPTNLIFAHRVLLHSYPILPNERLISAYSLLATSPQRTLHFIC